MNLVTSRNNLASFLAATFLLSAVAYIGEVAAAVITFARQCHCFRRDTNNNPRFSASVSWRQLTWEISCDEESCRSRWRSSMRRRWRCESATAAGDGGVGGHQWHRRPAYTPPDDACVMGIRAPTSSGCVAFVASRCVDPRIHISTSSSRCRIVEIVHSEYLVSAALACSTCSTVARTARKIHSL